MGKAKNDDDNTPEAKNLVRAMLLAPQMMDSAAYQLDNAVKDVMQFGPKQRTGLIEE
jgi:hypothetical protein